jgi:ribosome-associated translation inhibitor RaiA
MRRRVEAAVTRTAARLRRTVDAILRFEQDGPVKRVEIVLHAARQRNLVARGEGRYFGSAFTAANDRLVAQIRTLRKNQRTARRVQPAEKAATN